ncbi:unnamed protein product, partial [Rotaria sp. Silwood1]
LKYFTFYGPLPGLSPQFLFGNLLQTGLLTGNSFPQIYTSLKNRFGDIYQVQFGFVHAKVIGNIDDIQHIFTHRNVYDQGDWFVELYGAILPSALITLKGTKYKRHGAVSMSLFRRSRIVSNFDTILDCTDKLLDNWRSFSVHHLHLDIVLQCQNLLLQIFGLIAFDYDFETLNGRNSNELAQALRNFFSTIEIASYLPNTLFRIFLKLSPQYQRQRAIIERYIYRMIEQEFNESPESRAQRKKTSLIASLVDSLQIDEEAEAKKSEELKKGLSRSEVFDEMLMFLIAGFETTSTALAWSIHLLSKYPHVQEKIKAELINNSVTQLLTPERLQSLIYLDCVIKEILRYSSPFDSTVRTLVADDRLPHSGVQLYKGDQVIIPFSILALDSRYWSIDPNLFYPERFLGEDKNHHPYVFLPFGSGHRQCIGQDLARFELKVILARLMQYVTFGDGGPEVNAGGHLQKMTIMPKYVGITIKFDA